MAKERVRNKNVNKGGQGQQGGEHKQIKTRDQEEQQQQNTKDGSSEQQPEQQKEKEWQVSRRRNNRPQEEKTQKTVWRPPSPQNKVSKEQPQITAHQIGTISISNHNPFTNLNMHEKQMEDSQEHNSNEGTTQGAQNRSKADQHQKAQAKQT
ncbi:hypothetical protein H5410_046283 [Solanum commersonii]|uniref:Uncharacterized protein n=1 Tax=Solanum commersonii TaxID=4109 RepID=A0A9J5XBU6_SOLCO|nr:hypothetical protein H5410_046283 [Solanum commersonii]